MAIEIRRATSEDMPHVLDILLTDPAPDLRAVVPDVRKTRVVGELLGGYGMLVSIDQTKVATEEGVAVGLVETLRSRSDAAVGLRASLFIVGRAVMVAGPLVLKRYVQLTRARTRMDIRIPAGEFDLNELDVHPSRRNRGIGGQLLGHAIESAAAAGYRTVWLTTEISNPARRLYERSGFRVVKSATDDVYEQMTGAPGRVVMSKAL
jgi:ribosomal protein S18 acetylase RimI-like enzyme